MLSDVVSIKNEVLGTGNRLVIVVVKYFRFFSTKINLCCVMFQQQCPQPAEKSNCSNELVGFLKTPICLSNWGRHTVLKSINKIISFMRTFRLFPMRMRVVVLKIITFTRYKIGIASKYRFIEPQAKRRVYPPKLNDGTWIWKATVFFTYIF